MITDLLINLMLVRYQSFCVPQRFVYLFFMVSKLFIEKWTSGFQCLFQSDLGLYLQ